MITWITDEIAIGDSEDARNIDNKVFNATLNVAIDLDIADDFKWRHKVGLLDGPGNSPMTFMAAVLLLEALVKQEKRILVHCHEGKSRSVMVVATWLKRRGYTSLDEGLQEIMRFRKVDVFRPALRETAEQALKLMGINTI